MLERQEGARSGRTFGDILGNLTSIMKTEEKH